MHMKAHLRGRKGSGPSNHKTFHYAAVWWSCDRPALIWACKTPNLPSHFRASHARGTTHSVSYCSSREVLEGGHTLLRKAGRFPGSLSSHYRIKEFYRRRNQEALVSLKPHSKGNNSKGNSTMEHGTPWTEAAPASAAVELLTRYLGVPTVTPEHHRRTSEMTKWPQCSAAASWVSGALSKLYGRAEM